MTGPQTAIAPEPGTAAEPAPAPAEARANAPNPAPAQAAEKPAPAPAADFTKPPATENHVFVPSAEFKAMQDELAQYKALRETQAKEAEKARIRELQKQAKDDPLAALDAQRAALEAEIRSREERIQAMENDRLAERLEAEIDSVLSTYQLAGDTPEERAYYRTILKDHLRPQFVAEKTPAGNITVRERVSYRPADAVLHERLRGKSLALFLAPTTRGGSGSDGTRPPATTQQPELNEIQRQQVAYMKSLSQYPAIGFGPKAAKG